MSELDDDEGWLTSDTNWKTRLQSGFKGQRILGVGSYGIAGLWSYEGPPETAPAIQHVVAKECEIAKFDKREDVFVEGRILSMLEKVQSRHILRMYGPVMNDENLGEEVVRLFLEYCPDGDLGRLLNPKPTGRKNEIVKPPRTPILEVDLWAMFYCLALGLAVMGRGTEDDTAPDFGTAIEEPRMDQQTDQTGIGKLFAGESFYRPPEADPEIKRQLENPRKGTTSNIFQTTKDFRTPLVQVIKVGQKAPPVGIQETWSKSQGSDLEDIDPSIYSKGLIDLVVICLMREPLQRPNALDLQRMVRMGLDTAKAVTETQNLLEYTGMVDIPMVQILWPQPPEFVMQPLEPLKGKRKLAGGSGASPRPRKRNAGSQIPF
ncbi:uncharacterized protein LY89DRAFT_715236 [Mollisia scopiformis]|uniref:Protein kinase domain-containing protein n=1 Tax=Mollisia scopiformis TaxID=149040 RepID=A0A194XLC6_MOLSC|nr:uncharacterized protein LY89DRAFT_715236 [Mollisia scopiformis]KUJ20931.1 hypothetical protein LY89DRAFT_715236 [Mollisia scopiformis]